VGSSVAERFDYELAIVGGGPAGASTALHLVRREGVSPRKIAVLDKARFPRDKPCAGAVSQAGVDVLAELGIGIDVPSVEMRGVRVLSGDDTGETFEPMGVVIRRTEFDAHLLRSAASDGVAVLEGAALTAIERTGPRSGFQLTTSRGDKITARFVVAADGAGSTTRKLLGIREPDRKGHLYVLDTPSGPADTGVARGLVDFDLSVLDDGLEGYYWDFPTMLDGELQVSRGIYHANFTRPDSPTGESVKDVLARSLAKRGVDIAKVKLRPFSTRPFVPSSIAWVPGVMLVGEACGIDQTTGEGIAQAIEMGRLAAHHASRALEPRDPRFDRYERDLRASTMGRHLLQSAFFARRVYGTFRKARRYLLRSSYARTEAVRWYRGEPLTVGAQLKLGIGLAGTFLSTQPSSS
jgi:flavin-dependent dehydrogenase